VLAATLLFYVAPSSAALAQAARRVICKPLKHLGSQLGDSIVRCTTQRLICTLSFQYVCRLSNDVASNERLDSPRSATPSHEAAEQVHQLVSYSLVQLLLIRAFTS
jgi:hypothetical protein